MGYLILEMVLFVPGALAFVIGKVPLTRRRRVNGSAARIVGVMLMIPLALYLIACKRSHLNPLGSDIHDLDPLLPHTEGFVHLVAIAGAFACFLAAMVFAIVTSEMRRR
jgi:hypothetical protein